MYGDKLYTNFCILIIQFVGLEAGLPILIFYI